MAHKLVDHEIAWLTVIIGVFEGAFIVSAIMVGLGKINPENPLVAMFFFGVVTLGMPLLAYLFLRDSVRFNKHRLKERYQ